MRTRSIRISAVVVALGLLLGACGDGNRGPVCDDTGSCAGSGPGNGSGNGNGNGGNGGGQAEGIDSSADIAKVAQNLGFVLAPFDPATGMAGDLKITGARPPVVPSNDPNAVSLNAANRYIMWPYGMSESSGGGSKVDVQASYFLPLGTPIISMVSGTVCDVPKLYSDDYSVRVAPDGVSCGNQGGAAVLFETEHVIDPLVKVGDRVTAGQRVATVGTYRRDWTAAGFGIVEIGVAYMKNGSDRPWHACPSITLDPKIAPTLLADLSAANAAWAKELGDDSLYAGDAMPGCRIATDVTE